MRLRSKGTALLQSVSAVYVAITQVRSLSITGEKSETTDGVTLDQTSAYKPKDGTGYTEPCVIKAEVFYDPSNTSHISFTALPAAPVDTNFKVTYTDTVPTSVIYKGTGFGVDKTMNPAENVMGTFEIQTSGTPT